MIWIVAAFIAGVWIATGAWALIGIADWIERIR